MDNEEAPELCDYAFPRIAHRDPLYGGRIVGQRGMTLRDYFAAQVLNGMLAGRTSLSQDQYAAAAYEIADDMMKARAALGEEK